MKLTTRQLRRIIAEELYLESPPGGEAIPPLVDKWQKEVSTVKMGDQPPPKEIVDTQAEELKKRIEAFLTNAEEKVRRSKEAHDASKRGGTSGPASSRSPGVKESISFSTLKKFIRETMSDVLV